MAKKMHHLNIGNESYEVVDDSARSDLRVLGAKTQSYPIALDDFIFDVTGCTVDYDHSYVTRTGNVIAFHISFATNANTTDVSIQIDGQYAPWHEDSEDRNLALVLTNVDDANSFTTGQLVWDDNNEEAYILSSYVEGNTEYIASGAYVAIGQDYYDADPDAVVLADGSVSEAKLNADLQAKINSALGKGSGQPIPVTTAAKMTDHDTLYLYIGSETGFSYGHWYYYDADDHEWVDSGQYGIGVAGEDGTDGTTFTPSVSSAGVVSWTNDDGKTNPKSVDLIPPVVAALSDWAEQTISSGGAVSQALSPYVIYHFTGNLTSLTITLTAPASGVIPHYHFDFSSGSTAPTLSVPSAVTMPDNFAVETSKRYEVDILHNFGAVTEWTI